MTTIPVITIGLVMREASTSRSIEEVSWIM
jgi:hypothetical protein